MSSTEIRQGCVCLGSGRVAVTYPRMFNSWFDGVVEPAHEHIATRKWVRLRARDDASGFDVLASAALPAMRLDLGDALATFWERVAFLSVDDLRGAIALHAAAICHGKGVVLLPGQTGAGKTRLSLWYRARGFDVGTDEIVIASVRPRSTTNLILGEALRRPLILKDLVDANALLAPSNKPIAQQVSSRGLLLRLSLGSSCGKKPIKRGLIVFPRFIPGAPFTLTALTPGQACLGLMENCLNARNLPHGGLPIAGELARQLPAVSLEYGNTAQLGGTLDGLTNQVQAAPLRFGDLAALCAAFTGRSRHEAQHVLRCRKNDDNETPDAGGRTGRQHVSDEAPAPDILISRWWGRFGNNMHQYAFAATYAKTHKSRVIMPEWWEGVDVFAIPEHYLADERLRTEINALRRQKHEHCVVEYMVNYYDKYGIAEEERYQKLDVSHGYPLVLCSDHSRSKVAFEDLCAYNEAVFDGMHIEQLRAIFEFNVKVKDLLTYKYWQSRQGTYDAAHIRRTNSVNVGWFVKVSRDSYVRAMQSEGIDEDSAIWVSDDPKLRRNCAPVLPSLTEAFDVRQHGFPWLEDFFILYFARRIFRANSSFSWWAAALSPQAIVFSPDLSQTSADVIGEQSVGFIRGNRQHWYPTDVKMNVVGME